MIFIFVDFTEQEKAQMDAIEEKYQAIFKTLDAIIDSRTDEQPEFLPYVKYPEKLSKAEYERIKKENDAISAANDEMYKNWEEAGGEEWNEARKQWDITNDNYNNERREFFKKAELRQFKILGNDLDKILKDAKEQVKKAINSQYEYYKEMESRGGWFSSIAVCALEDGTWLLDEEDLRKTINGTLHLHIEVLEKHEELLKELNNYIDKTLKDNTHVAPAGHPGKFQRVSPKRELINYSEATVNTKYPSNYITPTDKVTKYAFCGELTGKQLQSLAMERRGSKKQITTLASIDFENLNSAIKIGGKRELTAYDREVHDAIITLFVDGGNEYITPQMIYQVMIGNPDAFLNPKQAEAISDSITKFLYSRVIIDASEEAKAYGFESFKYDGNLISGERVTATLNGNVLECLHILRQPILYELANNKNQIGRFDIKLLNSPINKTEEIITLQGYLYRRILSFKGSSNLSNTIVYETLYNQLELAATSEGALRKKKSKIRGQIKTILDYWKDQKFIKEYEEIQKGKELYSISISV